MGQAASKRKLRALSSRWQDPVDGAMREVNCTMDDIAVMAWGTLTQSSGGITKSLADHSNGWGGRR